MHTTEKAQAAAQAEIDAILAKNIDAHCDRSFYAADHIDIADWRAMFGRTRDRLRLASEANRLLAEGKLSKEQYERATKDKATP